MGTAGISRRGLVGGVAAGAAVALLPAQGAQAAKAKTARRAAPGAKALRARKAREKALKARARALKAREAQARAEALRRRQQPTRAGAGAPPRQAPAAVVSTADGYLPSDRALHVLRRMTYGPTRDSIAEINALGIDQWLERQLAPASIADPVCDQVLTTLPRLSWSIATTRAQLDNGSWDVMEDLGRATVARAVWSNRQLLEVMVDFWSNHLNVTNPSSDVWDSRHRYDADVIRPHALGRFADMLQASAAHPAMLNYLDNADSTKTHPNENYGRELLELHTVGVGAGYTQTEVVSSARIMTGYSLDWNTGQFLYRSNTHWTGAVSVLGFTAANTAADGRSVVTAYLDHLAHHPSTAANIARKLYLRFVGDVPAPSAVATLAKAYLDNDTQIKPVLRALLALPEFRHTPGVKVRRPFESVVAGLRTLGVQPGSLSNPDNYRRGLDGVFWQIQDLGHGPLGWPAPNGYPDVAVAWQSASGLVGRWNTHLSHTAGWWPSKTDKMLTYPDLATFLPSPLPATYGEVLDALSNRVVHRTLRPAHRTAVLAFMGKAATAVPKATDAPLSWRLPYVIALLLDSPYHGYR